MKNLLLLLALIATTTLMAQVQLERQVVSSGGQSTSSGNLHLEYTIGEPAVATLSSATLILTQGFQQPTQKPVGIEVPEWNADIKAFPNPTADAIILEVSASDRLDLLIELFDMQGRQVPGTGIRMNVDGTATTTIDFSGMAAGQYLVRLHDKNSNLHRTITVQKVN